MDEILEKIHREGRTALTDEENRFLVRVSTRLRNRTKTHVSGFGSGVAPRPEVTRLPAIPRRQRTARPISEIVRVPPRFLAALDRGPVVLDAAMGTRLIARGLDLRSDDPSLWNLTHPAEVLDDPPTRRRGRLPGPLHQHLRRQPVLAREVRPRRRRRGDQSTGRRAGAQGRRSGWVRRRRHRPHGRRGARGRGRAGGGPARFRRQRPGLRDLSSRTAVSRAPRSPVEPGDRGADPRQPLGMARACRDDGAAAAGPGRRGDRDQLPARRRAGAGAGASPGSRRLVSHPRQAERIGRRGDRRHRARPRSPRLCRGSSISTSACSAAAAARPRPTSLPSPRHAPRIRTGTASIAPESARETPPESPRRRSPAANSSSPANASATTARASVVAISPCRSTIP